MIENQWSLLNNGASQEKQKHKAKLLNDEPSVDIYVGTDDLFRDHT